MNRRQSVINVVVRAGLIAKFRKFQMKCNFCTLRKQTQHTCVCVCLIIINYLNLPPTKFRNFELWQTKDLGNELGLSRFLWLKISAHTGCQAGGKHSYVFIYISIYVYGYMAIKYLCVRVCVYLRRSVKWRTAASSRQHWLLLLPRNCCYI